MEKISGFESLAAEFDHTCAITNGMDELVLAINESNELTPDAVYADTVLKLNGIELVELAGTEGFLDGVKRGSLKIYEWIKELIKTIRSWFSGSNKKKYDEAKKDLNDEVLFSDWVKDLEQKGIDGFTKHDPDENVVAVIRRMPREAKEEVNRAIKTIEAVATSTPEEVNQAVIGTVLSTIAGRTQSAMKSIDSRIEEINRIDPTGETLSSLGLSKNSTVVDRAKASGSELSKADQRDFANSVKALVKDSEAVQSELAKATIAMDKMNEAAKGHENNERGSQLSRAVSVLKLVAEIAGIYRDVIITVNSQMLIGYKQAVGTIVKTAIREALKHSDDLTSKYLDDAIAAL